MPSTLHANESLVSRETGISLVYDAAIDSPGFGVNGLLKRVSWLRCVFSTKDTASVVLFRAFTDDSQSVSTGL